MSDKPDPGCKDHPSVPTHPPMNRFLVVTALAFLMNGGFSLASTEVVMKDKEGMDAWVYTPAAAPEAGRTYWLVVGVHGLGGKGKGAMGLSPWAVDDVIVLGPSFLDGYQSGDGANADKLKDLIRQIGGKWKLHPKILLHGFSAGAQFAHRFAIHNPELVGVASAHSAGSWSLPDVKARSVFFAVSCGEADTQKADPRMELNRLDGLRAFARALEERKVPHEVKTWPGVGHSQCPQAIEMAKRAFQSLRDQGRKAAPTR